MQSACGVKLKVGKMQSFERFSYGLTEQISQTSFGAKGDLLAVWSTRALAFKDQKAVLSAELALEQDLTN